MIDIFERINDDIIEPNFYKFHYLKYPEGFLSNEINYTNTESTINQFTEPEGITIFRFLAIGNAYLNNEEINEILKEIIEIGKIPEGKKKNLDDFFGYDVSEWGNLENIYFIPFKFTSTQTIYAVKNILSNYLSPFTFKDSINPFGTFVISKENMFMFTFSNKEEKETEEEDTKSKKKLLSILNKKFIEGNLKYDREMVSYELSNFFFPLEIIDELSNLPINDLIKKLETDNYNIYFELRERYVNCGYRIQDKFLNEITSLPYPIDYLNSELSLKNLKIDSFNTNKIIRDITNNNNFYFYILNNIVEINEDKSFNENYIRFFPLVNDKNYSEILKIEFNKEEELKIIENRESFSKLSTIEEIIDGYKVDDYLENTFKYFTIKHPIVFPNNYELIRMFNDIKLSYQIPFMKFKDPLTKDIIYKIYKPITQISSSGYLPIVSKEELTDWIKYSGFDPNNDKITPIKTNPRELSLKIKIDDYPEIDSFFNGIVKRVISLEQTTYDIEYEGVIYPNVSTKFLKEKKEYKEGDKISFKKFKTKYADLNISLKGFVTFVIDLSDINQIGKGKIDLNEIINKYNEILKILFNLESVEIVRGFQNEITNNDLLVKGDLNNLLINLYQKELKKPLVYSRLFSLINFFYPYLVYDEMVFKPNDMVKYFDIEIRDWVNAKVIEFIGNKIKLSVFDLKKGIKKEKEVIVDRKFVRSIEEEEFRQYFNLRYKRVSNFDGGNAIRNLIMKLNNSNIPKSIILEKVEETFGISRELALKKLGDVIETEGKTLEKIRGNIGIGISIDWVNPKNGMYEIKLDNINSIGDLQHTINIIKLCFKLYDFIVNDAENEYFEKYREFLEMVFSEDLIENLEEQDKLSEIQQDTNKGLEEELFRETEGDVFDVFAEIEEEPEEVPLEEIKVDLRKDIDREYREEILLVEGKHSSNNVILEKLYEIDPELFDWSSTDAKTYSKICQSIKRYPKVMSDKTKDTVDSIDNRRKLNGLKSRYATSKDDIDCLEKDKSNISGTSKTKCKAIRWGSNDDNKYWYICPRIWDMYEQIPLAVEDLDYEYEGKPYKFISLDPETKNWRTDKATLLDITEFKPSYKGRGFFDESRQKIAPTPTKSLLFMSRSDNYSYPGFLNPGIHPKSMYVPCCFGDKSMRVDEAFKTNDEREKASSNHVKNWGKVLKPNDIGLVPNKLKKILEIDGLTNYEAGDISTKSAFFRCGIEQGNNVFFSLISKLIGITIDELKIEIIDHLTEDDFETLNRGNLAIWFMNNSLTSSFQNFLEYTLSEQEKKWEFYYDLLTRPNEWLFPDGLNLVILDYSIINNNESISVICTDYICDSKWKNEAPMVLVLKYNNVLEPIFYYKKTKIPAYTEFIEKNDGKISNVIKNFKKLIEICHSNSNNFEAYSVVNKNFASNHNSIYGYNLRENFSFDIVYNDYKEEIKYLVSDNYNKIIGIVLINNLYIPTFPSGKPTGLKTDIINIEKLTDKLDLRRSLELYSGLKNKYKLFPAIYLYKINREKTKKITGFICQYGFVIPTKDHSEIDDLEKVYDYSHIDKSISYHREKLIRSSYEIPMKYNEVIEKLRIINKDLKNKLEIKNIVTDYFKKSTDKKVVLGSEFYIGLVVSFSNDLTEVIIPFEKVEKNGELYKSINNFIRENRIREIRVKDFRIKNLKLYLENSSKIKLLSGYELDVLPKSGLMERNKSYSKIVLESGIIVDLEEKFYLKSSNNTNLINDNYVKNSLISFDENEYIDVDNKMIKNVLEINYKKDILNSLRIQIANFVNKIENRDIKQLIRDIINEIKLSNSQKRKIIQDIIRFCYSVLVNDSIIKDFPKVDSDLVLLNLTKLECSEINWSIFNMPELYLEINKNSNSFLTDYNKELEKIFNKQSEIYNKEICRLNIFEKDKNNFIDIITDEIIRNRYRREQILQNKSLKRVTERYQYNKATEILIEGIKLNNEWIADLYNVLRQQLYQKYFPIDLKIDFPKEKIDSREIPEVFSSQKKLGNVRIPIYEIKPGIKKIELKYEGIDVEKLKLLSKQKLTIIKA